MLCLLSKFEYIAITSSNFFCDLLIFGILQVNLEYFCIDSQVTLKTPCFIYFNYVHLAKWNIKRTSFLLILLCNSNARHS